MAEGTPLLDTTTTFSLRLKRDASQLLALWSWKWGEWDVNHSRWLRTHKTDNPEVVRHPQRYWINS